MAHGPYFFWAKKAPTLQEIIFAVDRATLCPGNPEEKYVSVCRRRKDGEICGERGFGQTIGYIDVRYLHGNKIIVDMHCR